MNAKQLKPFIIQAVGALSLAFHNRPVIVWALHIIEGAVLSALDDGTLDEVVARAHMAVREDDPA